MPMDGWATPGGNEPAFYLPAPPFTSIPTLPQLSKGHHRDRRPARQGRCRQVLRPGRQPRPLHQGSGPHGAPAGRHTAAAQQQARGGHRCRSVGGWVGRVSSVCTLGRMAAEWIPGCQKWELWELPLLNPLGVHSKYLNRKPLTMDPSLLRSRHPQRWAGRRRPGAGREVVPGRGFDGEDLLPDCTLTVHCRGHLALVERSLLFMVGNLIECAAGPLSGWIWTLGFLHAVTPPP